MKIIEVIKLIWRQILSLQESKELFFHGKSELIDNKKYDRLFRVGKKARIEICYYSSENNRIYLKTEDNITVATDQNYNMLIEVLITKIYSLPPHVSNYQFYVFDIGMNRGYTSLYFANMKNCKRIFGFEIDNQSYRWAIENFSLNDNISSKIEHYNFGLWNETKEIDIFSYEDDYCTTVSNNEVKNENDSIQRKYSKKKAKVLKSSQILADIFEKIEKTPLRILKIDIEGAEYMVFDDLFKHNLIDEFDLLIGECHNGITELEKYLGNYLCSYKKACTDKRIEFCYINRNSQIIKTR